MCTDYYFDIILTIPEWLRDELPETPEPDVKFFTDTYIDNYRFKPKDPITTDPLMRTYLEDNGLDLDNCTLMQRPKTNDYEAIINGYQIYRVHWIIECGFDEENCYVTIPETASSFIDEVYRATHENCFTNLEIMHSMDPWEDSWIHKRISYAEFHAQALCNKADALLNNIERNISERVTSTMDDLRSQMKKQAQTMRDGLYIQHGALLKDVKAFEERVKKTLASKEEPKNNQTEMNTLKDMLNRNQLMSQQLKENRIINISLMVIQICVIFLLMLHYFTFN